MSEFIGTKSHIQCKTYYNSFNKKLRFDELYNEYNGKNDEESSFSENETVRVVKPRGKPGRKRGRQPAAIAASEEKKDDDDKNDEDFEDETENAEKEEKEEAEPGEEKVKVKRGRRKSAAREAAEANPDSPGGPLGLWSTGEKQDFIKYLAIYGKNWKAIAFHIINKTVEQIEEYYDKNKVKLNLVELLESTKDTREPGEKKRRLSDKPVYVPAPVPTPAPQPTERRGPGRPKKLKSEDKKPSSGNLSPAITAIHPASPAALAIPSSPGAPSLISPGASTPTGGPQGPVFPSAVSGIVVKKKGRGRKPKSAMQPTAESPNVSPRSV